MIVKILLLSMILRVECQRVNIEDPGTIVDIRGGIPGVYEFPFLGGEGFGPDLPGLKQALPLNNPRLLPDARSINPLPVNNPRLLPTGRAVQPLPINNPRVLPTGRAVQPLPINNPRLLPYGRAVRPLPINNPRILPVQYVPRSYYRPSEAARERIGRGRGTDESYWSRRDTERRWRNRLRYLSNGRPNSSQRARRQRRTE